MSDTISKVLSEQLDLDSEMTFEEIMAELRRISASIRVQQFEIDRLKAESDSITAHTDKVKRSLRLELDALASTR